jgi:beta-lactamase regulating signal transducer with metallopeptidase domain
MSWLVDTLIVTGALIAAVLVLRRPVARWFGPGAAYALWALPLLRLVLPPLVLPARVSEAPVAATAGSETMTIALASEPAVAAVPAINWLALAQSGWLAGAITFLVWRIWSYQAMRRLLLDGARPVGEAGRVRLVETPATAAPVAFGIFDKVVALPVGFMASTDIHSRDLAIAHELEHHAGRDLAVNLAVQPLLALHWFNPLAWAGWRALRRDQEAACDARVMSGRDRATRAAYGRLIAGFAQSPRLALAAPMACPVLGDKSVVHRLRSLTMSEPSPRRRLIGRLMFGAAALTLPLTATITYAAIGQPEPPAPPAAPDAVEAPAPVDGPQVERRVEKFVIIDDPKGATIDDPTLHTRVVKRDGKTIVIKSRENLSEAEAEARVAKAMASAAEAEAEVARASAEAHRAGAEAARAGAEAARASAMAWSHAPVHVEVDTHDKGGKRREVTRVVVRDGGHGKAKAFAFSDKGSKCNDRDDMVRAKVSEDGKRHELRINACGLGKEVRLDILEGLREARADVANDEDIPAETKAEVLKSLDNEIARIAKEG